MPMIHMQPYWIFKELGRLQVRMIHLANKANIYFLAQHFIHNLIRGACDDFIVSVWEFLL